MNIVVRGRNVEVPEHYRTLVGEKLERIERYDHKVIRLDVELYHEKNPRQSGACQHVEITCASRGPVVRSEASAADFYAALDAAVAKFESRLRKAADRRRVHHGHARRAGVFETAGHLDAVDAEAFQPPAGDGRKGPSGAADSNSRTTAATDQPDETDLDVTAELGRIVRRKWHEARPMTSDQALHNMELVGHDFYLFADGETGLPSVVYRRKGFAYGVIHLTPEAVPAAADNDGATAPASGGGDMAPASGGGDHVAVPADARGAASG